MNFSDKASTGGRKRRLLAGATMVGAMMIAGSALAQPVATAPVAQAPDERDARINQLQAEVQALADANAREAAQVQALAAEVAGLKQGQAAQGQQIQTVAKSVPPPPAAVASIPGGKPTISSADGRFTASLHGIVQFDAATYEQASAQPIATDLRRSGPALGSSSANADAAHARDLKDGDLFRRARIGMDGVVFGDLDYRLIFDFGGSGVENTGQLYEAWFQYSGFKPLKLRVGAFSPSIGLEDQGSTNTMPLIERSAAGDLARNFVAGDTRTAVEAFANGDHWLVSGAITGRTIGVISTGAAAAVPQTFGDQLGLVGRVAFTPLHGADWLVHFGGHGSYLVTPPDNTGPPASGTSPLSRYVAAFSNTAELRVDGTKLINTGNIDASHAGEMGLEFAVQKQNFFLQSEYEYFTVQRTDPGISSPHFMGYYVEGSWILTGETRKYNPVTAAFDGPPVAHPFSPKAGHWGAWELAARYSEMDLNYDAGTLGSAPAADAIRGGDLKVFSLGMNWYLNPVVRFMFDYQHVDLNRLSPNATNYQTPTGAQIGQTYDALAVRSQIAF